MSGMIGFRHSKPGGSNDWATAALARETSLFIFGAIVYHSERVEALRGHHLNLNLNSQLKYLAIIGGVLRTYLFMSVPTPTP